MPQAKAFSENIFFSSEKKVLDAAGDIDIHMERLAHPNLPRAALHGIRFWDFQLIIQMHPRCSKGGGEGRGGEGKRSRNHVRY